MRALAVASLIGILGITAKPARGEISAAEQALQNDVQKFNQQYLDGNTNGNYVYDFAPPVSTNPYDAANVSATTSLNPAEKGQVDSVIGAASTYESCVAGCVQANLSLSADRQSSICATRCSERYPQNFPNQCWQSSANGISVAQNCGRLDSNTPQSRVQIEMLSTPKN